MTHLLPASGLRSVQELSRRGRSAGSAGGGRKKVASAPVQHQDRMMAATPEMVVVGGARLVALYLHGQRVQVPRHLWERRSLPEPVPPAGRLQSFSSSPVWIRWRRQSPKQARQRGLGGEGVRLARDRARPNGQSPRRDETARRKRGPSRRSSVTIWSLQSCPCSDRRVRSNSSNGWVSGPDSGGRPATRP